MEPELPQTPEDVVLQDPHGKLVTVAPEEVQPSITQGGYKIAPQAVIQKFDDQQKYGSTGQQLLTGLEGAGVGATFGLSTAVERGLSSAGVPGLSDEDITKRREVNPGSHMIGEGLGMAGTSIAGFGAGAAAESLGTAGAAALVGTGEGAAARIGSKAVNDAIQFGLLQSGSEASKLLTSEDPGAGAGAALLNIGLSSALGGAFGAGFGAMSPLWKGVAESDLGKTLQMISEKAGGQSAVSDPIADAIQQSGMNISPEITASLSNNRILRDAANVLRQSDSSAAGPAYQASQEAFTKEASSELVSAAGRSTDGLESVRNLSPFQAGSDIKQGLVDDFMTSSQGALEDELAHQTFKKEAPNQVLEAFGKTPDDVAALKNYSANEAGAGLRNTLAQEVKQTIEPTSELLDSVAKDFKGVKASAEDLGFIQSRIAKLADEQGYAKAPFSKENGFIQSVLESLPKQETVEDLRKFASNVFQNTKTPELSYLGKRLYGIFKDSEYSIIENTLKDKAPELLQRYSLANQTYREFKNLLEQVNDRLHVGRYKGASTFIDALLEQKPETVLSRLTSSKDADLLQLLEKNFPLTSSQVKDAHLDNVLRNAASKSKEGLIDVANIHSELGKLSPELKAYAVSPEAQSSIERAMQGLSKENSPSYEMAMQKATQLNQQLKLGKFDGPTEFAELLSKANPESLLRKLENSSDASTYDYLVQNFPKAAEDLKNYQVSDILKSSSQMGKDGVSELNPTKFIKSVEALTPEAKKFVFGDAGIQKIEAIQTLLNQIKNPTHNFSNTARTLSSLGKYLPAGVGAMISTLLGHSPLLGLAVGEASQYISKNVPDAMRLALLKFMGTAKPIEAEGFKTAVDFIHSMIQGENQMVKAVQTIFKSGAIATSQMALPSSDEKKKLEKTVEKLQEKPDAMMNIGGKTAYYLDHHATAMAQQSQQALQYLQKQKPNPQKTSPLDSEPVVGAAEKASYDRALQIGVKPLSILTDVKEGSLTPQDLAHIQALHPAVYQSLKQKMVNEMTDHLTDGGKIPYRTRMGMSLFLAEPMDSTLKPASIMDTQGTFQQNHSDTQDAPDARGGKAHSMKALSKVGASEMLPSQNRLQQRSQK